MKPGDVVIRKEPPASWGGLRRGHNYFGLNVGETGIVSAVEDEAVFIEKHGDWPHHLSTLEVIESED